MLSCQAQAVEGGRSWLRQLRRESCDVQEAAVGVDKEPGKEERVGPFVSAVAVAGPRQCA